VSVHPETRLRDPFTGRLVGIDTELVPVIEALWAHGIETNSSCQGPPVYDQAMIYFAEPKDYSESPGYWDPPDDGPGWDAWCAEASAWQAARPSGAEQAWRLLPDTVPRASWEFVFRDEPNAGSWLLLPAEDIPALARGLAAYRPRAGERITP
jgi:hypothetical protein